MSFIQLFLQLRARLCVWARKFAFNPLKIEYYYIDFAENELKTFAHSEKDSREREKRRLDEDFLENVHVRALEISSTKAVFQLQNQMRWIVVCVRVCVLFLQHRFPENPFSIHGTRTYIRIILHKVILTEYMQRRAYTRLRRIACTNRIK